MKYIYYSISAIITACILNACTIQAVTPYNQELVDRTELFYKEAATMIDKGIANSPKTSTQREAIQNPSEHAGNYKNFETDYNTLITSTEALVLRAMSQSTQVSKVAQKIQASLETVIETSIPSLCQQSALEIEAISLTAKNYVDLKCILTNWKVQHKDEGVTRGTSILKKANWEARKKVIFNAVLAMQQAETFKQ